MSDSSDLIERRHVRLGLAMVVLAAFGFGISPSGAKLAYTGGTEPLTLVVLRFTACAVALAGLVLVRHRRFALDRSHWPLAGILGCIFVSNAWCYMSAVDFIPVSLAVPLFYTFPIQVGLVAALIGEDRLNRRRVIALFAGFVGVVLTVGLGLAGVDWRGFALAFVAGTGVAWTTVLFGRGARRSDSLTFGFWVMTVAASVSGVVLAFGAGFTWPQTQVALEGFLITLLFFSGALVLYYLAIPMTGPVRAAMFANLEPIVALIAAAIMLGERPGPLQLAGAALIIGAVIYQSLGGRPAADRVS